MAVCRFFQAGYCKFGNSCKFEHPDPNANRFSAFGGGGGGGFGGQQNRGGFGQNSNDRNAAALPFALSKEALQKDLTEEKPQWILSAYGPGREAPEQLFGGFPREQSFEEVRLVFQEGLMAGNPQGALNQIEGLYRDAENQIQTAVNNLDGAVQFILDAQNKSPNRNSVLVNNSNGTFAVGARQQQSNPFGAPASQPSNPFGAPSTTTTSSGFGQPSAMGQKPNPFGTPAFGQPSQPTSAFGQPSQPTSAFGQPSQPTSAFGQPPQPTSAFGQPSAMGGGGGPTSSGFGQPSALGSGGSGFGQPSAMGQRPSAFGAPAFGQTTGMGAAGSAFGQASSLGPKPSPFGGGGGASSASPFSSMANNNGAGASAFGAAAPASANPTGSAFGQPSSLGGGGGFGQPSAAAGGGGGFGQPSALGAKPNPFGQPTTSSPFGQPQQAQTPGGFGAPAAAPSSAPEASMDMSISLPTPTTTSGFGQPAPAASNPFQQAAAQTQQAPAANPFGQPPSAPSTNPFGSAAPAATAAPAAAGGAGAGPSPYAPGATRQHPPASSYVVKNANGTLQTFKGQPVAYQAPREGYNGGKAFPVLRAFDGSVTRIWNPEGPPAYYGDTEAADRGAYDDPQVKAAYEVFVNTGRFQGGMLPEVPPLREWCAWDF